MKKKRNDVTTRLFTMWYLVMKNANRGKLGNDEREKENKKWED